MPVLCVMRIKEELVLVISVDGSAWKEFANACWVPHGPVHSILHFTEGKEEDSLLGGNLALLQGINKGFWSFMIFHDLHYFHLFHYLLLLQLLKN